MGGVSWSELAVIGIVALVVLGPKDMTRMFRMMGELTGKARAMAREFQKAMNAAADDAGVGDVAKTLRDTASGKSLRDAVGLDGLAKDLKEATRFDAGFGGKPLAKAKDKGSETASGAPPETPPDAAADMAESNAALAATEAERLKRAERAEAARVRAAEIRARREALAAEREAEATPAEPPAPGDTPPAAAPRA